VECKAGSFQDKGGQRDCIPCPGGYYQAGLRSDLCEGCTAGRFAAATGSAAEAACVKCAVGRVQPARGKASCNLCSAGNGSAHAEYQDQEGATVCRQCAGCVIGARQGCGLSFAGVCANCTPGKYESIESKRCADCPTGYFQEGTNAAQCQRCSAGKYTVDEGKAYCKAVAAGKQLVTRLGSGPVEIECSSGKFSTGDSTRCTHCPQGTAAVITHTVLTARTVRPR
jgi:hypothetical protein